ncbi:hypothetical protein OF83DRAFT_895473 [Amylostereum chailletii]|nr:hypothetical protein OF83DRAFT_895473 [Amylostereum chailletii]
MSLTQDRQCCLPNFHPEAEGVLVNTGPFSPTMPASASYATTTSVWLEMSPIRSSVERAFPSPIKHRFQKYPHATHESQNPLSAVFHKLSLIFSPLVGTLKTICLGASCDGSGGAHTGYTGNVHAPLSPATARAVSIHRRRKGVDLRLHDLLRGARAHGRIHRRRCVVSAPASASFPESHLRPTRRPETKQAWLLSSLSRR